MLRRAAFACALLLAPALPLRAAQPQFWRIEGAKDFLDGDTEGLSVDSEGQVRLAPASRVLNDPEAPYVWCLVRDGKGAVYAGTGNEGKIYRVEDGKGTLFYDAAELEIHALAFGPDGRLYAGSSPDGKVYAIDASGKADVFFDPEEKYIWALAFDHAGNLLVATGAEGRIYRIDRKGKAVSLLSTPDTHVVSLAQGAEGNLYAGSSPGGIVYRIDPAGKVFVLHDSAYREVTALGVGADGSVYAALVDGKEKQEAPRPVVPAPSPPVVATAEVTVTEGLGATPQSTAAPAPPVTRAPQPAATRGGPKGAMLRILPSGEVDTLWSSSDDAPHSLLAVDDGVLIGTGDQGKLYRVRDDRTWSMVGSFPGEQVTALAPAGKGSVVLATSNPGKTYALEAGAGLTGTFTSKAKDTETVSTWGRLRWEATLPSGTTVEIKTRSGNTDTPDSTWSEWSSPYTQPGGQPVVSDHARFLQVRAVLTGKQGASPVLDSITTAYLQRNLRPQVQSITVHPPGEIFQKPISLTGEIEVLGLEPEDAPDLRPGGVIPRPGAPPATAYSRKLYQKGIQTFTWKADDPNDDTLAYDVFYRQVGDARWRPLRKGLTDAVLAWDTSTVPNGRYLVKVTAWDTPSNPRPLALSGEKESAPFDIDNTPPTVTANLVERKPPRIRAVVRDDSSPVRKAEYAVDGGRWQEVHPLDGIDDSPEETYEILPGELPGPGPHIVVVRAMDLLGNVATARVEVP